MNWTRAEAEEQEHFDKHGWEEELHCENGHQWITLVWPDQLPSDPDCELCGRPGLRKP